MIMAPLAEKPDDPSVTESLSGVAPSTNSFSGAAPSKNVTFAVNYELSMVDQFCAIKKQRRKRTAVDTGGDDSSDTPLSASETQTPKRAFNLENDAPNAQDDERNDTGTTSTAATQERTVEIQSPTLNRRVSAREKQRATPKMARSRTRYDMEMVPVVVRNKSFLNAFPSWWKEQEPPRRSSRLTGVTVSENTFSLEEAPFAEDSSVLWIPSKRTEWEDTISEMTAVCTSAAMRRHDFSKPFLPPLSRDYIRDRVDIDDPLLGYQIRHKTGGWLQGFVLFTNFTTWTHGFHWDSKHPMSGFPENGSNMDLDGSLAQELEAQPRAGDPRGEGIVFPDIAEIGLLGGLGCGEYLLRMALDSIRSQKKYKYVVLQATEQSKTFYERFGFVRVGAICRYGVPQDGQTEEDMPIRGYRHWTHANESERSLQKHGGPSYMMCLKLPEEDAESEHRPSFVEAMMALKVEDKPRVELLGAASTPGPKFARRSNSMPIEISASYDSSGNASPRGGVTNKKKLLRRASDMKPTPSKRKSSAAPPIPPSSATSFARTANASIPAKNSTIRLSKQPKRSLSSDFKEDERSAKRQRLENSPGTKKPAAVPIPPPPPDGRPLSYAEKQYHSVWLAVPPSPGSNGLRPPPKQRASFADVKTPPKNGAPKRGRGRPKGSKNKPAAAVTKKAVPPTATNTSVLSRAATKSTPGSEKSKKSVGATPLSPTTAVGESGRIYHSVRGPDGKFKRVLVDGEAPSTSPAAANQSPPARATPIAEKKATPVRNVPIRPETPYVSLSLDIRKKRAPKSIDKETLKKQKVKSYPRNFVHFYNRVVKPKNGASPNEYYFVLQFDEKNNLILVVPMIARGKLAGKRAGRPRYQAVIGDTDANFKTVSADDYEVVRSAMVMKTPIVWQEAWDIEGENDTDFSTR